MSNYNKFWEKVSKGHRHTELDPTKRNRLIARFHEHIWKYISDDVESVLDWGCGGGDVISTVGMKTSVGIADVSQDSLITATEKLRGRIVYSTLIDAENLNYEGFNFDAVVCNDVVHHMRNLEMFKKHLKLWTEIANKYVAFSFKSAQKTKETDSYEGTNYLNALILSWKDVNDLLNENNLSLFQATIDYTENNKPLGFAVGKLK